MSCARSFTGLSSQGFTEFRNKTEISDFCNSYKTAYIGGFAARPGQPVYGIAIAYYHGKFWSPRRLWVPTTQDASRISKTPQLPRRYEGFSLRFSKHLIPRFQSVVSMVFRQTLSVKTSNSCPSYMERVPLSLVRHFTRRQPWKEQ